MRTALLGIAAIPFIYYGIAVFSCLRFFLATKSKADASNGFLPPVSNLQPVRGLDPDAYENFASLCRQDYPEYELLFCVNSENDPAVPVARELEGDFPGRAIRLLVGLGGRATRGGINDKVMKLARLESEARHE